MGARTLLLLLLLRSLPRLLPRERMKIHSTTKPLTFISLQEVRPSCLTFLRTFRGVGVSGCRGLLDGKRSEKAPTKGMCCIVCRTSVSCSPQGLGAWGSTWLRRTPWSSSTPTGTPRTTCRRRPEPIGLGRRSRSVGGASGVVWESGGGFAGLPGCSVKGFFLFSFLSQGEVSERASPATF